MVGLTKFPLSDSYGDTFGGGDVYSMGGGSGRGIYKEVEGRTRAKIESLQREGINVGG